MREAPRFRETAMPTHPGKPDHRSQGTRDRDARAAADEHEAMKHKAPDRGSPPSHGSDRPEHPQAGSSSK
jgi:hypothetical protein